MIPLFKSAYSLLRSILTLDPSSENPDYDLPDSIFQIAKDNNLKQVCLVDDSISSFLPANIQSRKEGVKLVFGQRITFVENPQDKTDVSLVGAHKNIIFPKNKSGYHRLIKLSTIAAVDNFYKEPRLSYHNLHENWNDDDLTLGVPFYDSFLHKNTLTNSMCVPDFGAIKPTLFVESNELPFDYLINEAVLHFADSNGLGVQPSKSIYYKNRKDFDAYLTLKCLNRKQFGAGRTLNAPDIEHMSSREFSWESYLEKVSRQ